MSLWECLQKRVAIVYFLLGKDSILPHIQEGQEVPGNYKFISLSSAPSREEMKQILLKVISKPRKILLGATMLVLSRLNLA